MDPELDAQLDAELAAMTAAGRTPTPSSHQPETPPPAAPGGTNTSQNTPGQATPNAGIEGTPAAVPGQAVTPPPVVPTTPATPAPAASPAAAAPAPQPAIPAGTGTEPANAGWQSARDYARSLGFTGAEQFQDDGTFLQSLVTQAQAAQQQAQLQPFAQQYLQHAGEFQQYLQAKQVEQEKARQQAQQPARLFNPPEWNDAWLAGITKDDKGTLGVAPGYPPEILAKYTAHQNYRRDLADKLMNDPEALLAPAIDARARAIAEQAVQANLQQYRDSVDAENYMQQNRTWLFQRDAQGREVAGANGQPVPSPAGRQFYQHLQHASNKLKLPSQTDRIQYAQAMTEREIYLAQVRQQQAGTVNQQQQAAVNAANRVPNVGGSTAPQAVNPETPQNPNLSLREQMLAAAKAMGLTDADITDGQ